MFPTNPIPFLCIFLILFVGISFGEPSYEWDSTSTVRNVHTFAKFIDDLYTEYSKSARMEYTNKLQKRAVFNCTFVKCAAEIAHFRVINANAETDEGGRPLRNFNIFQPDYANSMPFWLYDKSLGHQFANTFEKEIFAPAKEQKIGKTVANQIMQLAFSFAVRVLLCVIHEEYYNSFGIGKWQLRTLLSAFKRLSAQNDGDVNADNEIFPFQIIQIDTEGNHLWKQKLSVDGDKTEKSAQKQQKEQQRHYIENFNFILRLSASEYTQYEIVKVLDQIMLNKQKDKNDGITIYAVMLDHFRTSLSKGGIRNKIKLLLDNRLDCAVVNFGEELYKCIRWSHRDFSDHYRQKEKKCGENVHQQKLPPQNDLLLSIADNNTPKKDSNQIVLDIFHEPLWNYVRVIRIDSNINNARKQFCDELRSVVAVALAKKNKSQIQNLKQTNEFKWFLNALSYGDDDSMSIEIKSWSNNYDKKKSLDEQIDALKELQKIMDQILEEYKRANSFHLNEREKIFNIKYIIQKFGHFFCESLRKYNGDKVRYDEQRQLLTFPMEIGEHLISRLCTFMERNLTATFNQNYKIDFVSAMDAIASSRDNLESEKWIKIFGLTAYENIRSFDWLFTLALRLCWQMEGKNDFAEKYAPILHAHVAKLISFSKYNFFDYKINVEENLVRINLPNWEMPYLVYLENENELIEQRATKTFEFFSSLFIYSPTIFDVVKMAKILDKMNEENGRHIRIGQSDPELFRFILQNVTANSKDLNRINKILENDLSDKIELSVANSFCFLSHFVVQLLEKAIDEAEYLLKIENVKVFVGRTKTICTEEQIRGETLKIFGDNIAYIGKKMKIDFNLNADLQQKIIPNLIHELERMINSEEWNYTNLNDVKMTEWVLLEEGLMENGQRDKWEEIENLFNEWKKEFDDLASEHAKTKEVMERIVKKMNNNSFTDGCKWKIEFNNSDEHAKIKQLMEKIVKKLKILQMMNLQQKVLPDLIGELDMMVEKKEWNCAKLMDSIEDEWNLLEEGLMGNGQSDEWKKIKKLIDKWMKEYNKTFSEGKRPNFQKTVEVLKAKLVDLKNGKAKETEKKK